MATGVTYDGFDFEAAGCVITNVGHLTLPKRNNQIETLANRNGGFLVQSYLDTKSILIEGWFSGASRLQAEQMYDTLAAALNRQDRTLIIPHAGGSRYYTATPENIVIQQPNGLNRLTFSFEFVVPDGYAADQTASNLLTSQTVTTATSVIPVTVDGSVTARPLITLTYGTLTGGTSKTMSLRNGSDFIGLTFSRTFVASDTITIDCDAFQVYINGVLTVPNGRFPTWSPGSGTLYYSDTLTTRSVTISATYVKKNL